MITQQIQKNWAVESYSAQNVEQLFSQYGGNRNCGYELVVLGRLVKMFDDMRIRSQRTREI